MDVLTASKVDLRKRGRRAQLLSIPTDALIEDVVRVSRRLGRPAKAREYESQGDYSAVMLATRLGGWKQTKRIVSQRLYGQGANGRVRDADLSVSNSQAIDVFFSKQGGKAQLSS